jgi:hypothetical protein
MNMPKPFKFKERVIVSNPLGLPSEAQKGPHAGRIWELDDMRAEILGVRFDKNVGGHTLSVTTPCANGHGWYIKRQFIRRLPAKKA